MYYMIGNYSFDSDYLEHHGIKGQKWGVRRFQNLDGSYTEDGKVRYGISGSSNKSDKTSMINEPKQDKHVNSDGNEESSSGWTAAKFIATHLDALFNPVGLAIAVVDLGVGLRGVQKEKQYLRKRANKDEIDEETGLYLKNKETTEIEDMKAANPGFRNFSDDTKNNCSLCSAAFEMRRRGYDVIAKKDNYGKSASDQEKLYKGGKFKDYGVYEHVDDSSKYREDRKNAKENLRLFLEDISKQGNARGCMNVAWKSGGAHSMVYIVKDGKVSILDCQSGKQYSDPNKILKLGFGFSYMRTDNLEINMDEMKKRVM